MNFYRFWFLLFSLFFFGCAQKLTVESKIEPGTITVKEIISNTKIKAHSIKRKPEINEKLSFLSPEENVGVYGVGIVKKVTSLREGEYEFEMEIISLSPRYTVRVGDRVVSLDLSGQQIDYGGGTDRLVVKSSDRVSARYKPIVTQGLSIGETAETLWNKEYLFTYYGQLNYGLYDFLSIGTVLPLNVTGSPNAALKLRMYRSATNVVSTGITYTKIPNSDSSSLNLNFMWDSISNNDLITHNFITLAVVSFSNAVDVSAIKSIGTSSLQTGYEFIMSDWSRFLVGPNFNFEKKSVGGYFSYLKILDRIHLQFSINSTNIRSFKLSPTDGYYAFFDVYWRYQ
jgi:hypothetical protein